MVDKYRRFLQELLFVYNDDHPQQALRRRIQAALDCRWEDAFIIPEVITLDNWGKHGSDIEDKTESKHTELLSEGTTPTTKGPAPWN